MWAERKGRIKKIEKGEVGRRLKIFNSTGQVSENGVGPKAEVLGEYAGLESSEQPGATYYLPRPR